MPLVSNQDVFRFELTVNNPLPMQEMYRKQNLGDHVTDSSLSEDEVLLLGVKV